MIAGAAAQTVPPLGSVTETPVPAPLVARRHTTLSAEIPAKVDTISVKEGERFAAGDILISFDCSLQRAQLDEAEALFEAAVKTKAVHERLLELNASGVLETEMAVAEAAKAEAKLKPARVVISKCAIRAP
ncbi:MAG: biotin/lipoyl-binding protein, partial [Rhodospirillales bacterium]|nr:biotin/lipoyl-binding protein [Rhodospirillales bacterium]